MAIRIVDAIFSLRRDNDYNYEKIENTFIPLKGEVCFVDTSDGLLMKVGDGVTLFSQLDYFNNNSNSNVETYIVKGYFYKNNFYTDSEFNNVIKPSEKKIYIDLLDNLIYSYKNNNYICISSNIPTATSEMSGVLKLYNSTGENIDGTMTQKSITDELNNKVEIVLNEDDSEMITFLQKK